MFPTELDKAPLFSETSIVRAVFLGERKALANNFFLFLLHSQDTPWQTILSISLGFSQKMRNAPDRKMTKT